MVVRIRANILVGFIILGHLGRHMTFLCPLFISVMILVSYGHLSLFEVSSGSREVHKFVRFSKVIGESG